MTAATQQTLIGQLPTRVAFGMLAETAAAINASLDMKVSPYGNWIVVLRVAPNTVYNVYLDKAGRFWWAHSPNMPSSWHAKMPSVGQPPYTAKDARQDFLAYLWQTHAGMPLPATMQV